MTDRKCVTCGSIASEDGDRCDGCWEVERRIRDYMANKKGRENVRKILDEYDLIESTRDEV